MPIHYEIECSPYAGRPRPACVVLHDEDGHRHLARLTPGSTARQAAVEWAALATEHDRAGRTWRVAPRGDEYGLREGRPCRPGCRSVCGHVNHSYCVECRVEQRGEV